MRGYEKDWKQLIDKRCLIITKRWESQPAEVIVLEVSPDGKFVKFKFVKSNDTSWFSKYQITLEASLEEENEE